MPTHIRITGPDVEVGTNSCMGDTSVCLSCPTVPAFHFLQKHLWFWQLHMEKPRSHVLMLHFLLSRPLKPTAGAGCLLVPGAWEKSNSGQGRPVLLQQMVSIWFSQSSHLENSNTGSVILHWKEAEKGNTMPYQNSHQLQCLSEWNTIYKKRKRVQINMAHLLKCLTTVLWSWFYLFRFVVD